MLTINKLIDELKNVPNKELRVFYDFVNCIPTTVDSWRGIYAEPALGWEPSGYSGNVNKYPTVESLLKELESVRGNRYDGWKGGEYYYTGNETLHVDNPGDANDTIIERVEVKPGEVTLVTGAWRND